MHKRTSFVVVLNLTFVVVVNFTSAKNARGGKNISYVCEKLGIVCRCINITIVRTMPYLLVSN